MEGSGKMLVTAVGVHSQAGIIFTLLGAVEGTEAAPPPTAPTVTLNNKAEADGNVAVDTPLLQHQQTRDGNLPGSGNPAHSIVVSLFASGMF